LGNVWRFPFLCFQNGGSAFVFAFVVMLLCIGLPLFFLELTISQYSKCNVLKVWKICPIFKGIGMCTALISFFICLYYNVIICYCFIYLIASFMPNLPWIGCDHYWNNELCFENMDNSSMVGLASKLESPSKQFF
jgi:SNF family Na+-dependent transporter